MKMKRPYRRRTAGKAGTAQDVATLEDIPNVGPAVAADLRRLGITAPTDLLGRNPYAMYDDLCRITAAQSAEGRRPYPPPRFAASSE